MVDIIEKWDKRFLQMAELVSTWSKDPSTKVGAVYVKDRRILSTGYNGFPRCIDDSDLRLENRKEKYHLVLHAEINGIFNATHHGVPLKGTTLYIYGLPICSECAKGIIQIGVRRVVWWTKNPISETWAQSWNNSVELFEEAGIITEGLILSEL